MIDPYVEAWDQGQTPNPCIECNRHIKFDKLLERADVLGFDRIATGHHACVVATNDGTRRIGRGADPAKDQSYVLHMLDQDQLARLDLPVGDLTKDRVRELAAELGLRTADKPDSQDVCFIHSDGGRKQFLGDRIPLTPATIVDTRGHTVGRTEAVQLVTIGQRKGLDLGGASERRFVVDIDRASAVVTVGSHDDTLTDQLVLDDLRWTAGPIAGPITVQTSAHGAPAAATIDGAVVRWSMPHRRVAPGQSIAIYDGDTVVGGGTVGGGTGSRNPVDERPTA